MKNNGKTRITVKEFLEGFIKLLNKYYWSPLYEYICNNPNLITSFPGLLLDHRKIIVYLGRTHIGVEYTGPEHINKLPKDYGVEVQYFDYSISECNLLEKIIGFQFDSNVKTEFPLVPFSEDLFMATDKGWDKLHELGWNFSAQNLILGINSPCPMPMPVFSRIINGIFFDADEVGLKTRRIKWLDLFPVVFDGSDEELDSFRMEISYITQSVKSDAHYSFYIPEDFKLRQLPKINKFIEIWGDSANDERAITKFLSKKENEFILTMKFGAERIISEKKLEWQSEDNDPIIPDFFVVHPNGYADILEFKLPFIKSNTVVGTTNRESFSAWLNSYISQTRVYVKYFDDPNNRIWFEKKFGFKVHKPKRILVVGRRGDFNPDVWREIIADYSNIEILTYDDLIDGVVVQFYKE